MPLEQQRKRHIGLGIKLVKIYEYMEKLAVRLFPEHSSGLDAFQKPHMSIYQIFFALKDDVDEHIQLNNQEGLKRVFEFTEWCFEQKITVRIFGTPQRRHFWNTWQIMIKEQK